MTNEDLKPYLDRIEKSLKANNKTKAFNVLCEFSILAQKEGVKKGLADAAYLIKNRLDIQ